MLCNVLSVVMVQQCDGVKAERVILEAPRHPKKLWEWLGSVAREMPLRDC